MEREEVQTEKVGEGKGQVYINQKEFTGPDQLSTEE